MIITAPLYLCSGRIHDINIAGVVARPNSVTRTPRLASPVIKLEATRGLDNLGSCPTEIRICERGRLRRRDNHSAKAHPTKNITVGVNVIGSSGFTAKLN